MSSRPACQPEGHTEALLEDLVLVWKLHDLHPADGQDRAGQGARGLASSIRKRVQETLVWGMETPVDTTYLGKRAARVQLIHSGGTSRG